MFTNLKNMFLYIKTFDMPIVLLVLTLDHFCKCLMFSGVKHNNKSSQSALNA